MKPNPDKRPPIHVYSPLEKEAVMAKLEKNSGNVSTTAREVKINRNTLMKWRAEFEFEKKREAAVTKITGIQTANKKERVPPTIFQKDIEGSIVDYITMSKQVRDAALERIMDLIPHEQNIDFLTKLVVSIAKNLEHSGDGQGKEVASDTKIDQAIQSIGQTWEGSETSLKRITEELIQRNISVTK